MKPYCLDPCRSINPPTDVTCCVDEIGRAWACIDGDENKFIVDFYPGANKNMDTFSTFKFYNESATHDTLCGMFGLKLGMKLHGNERRPLS